MLTRKQRCQVPCKSHLRPQHSSEATALAETSWAERKQPSSACLASGDVLGQAFRWCQLTFDAEDVSTQKLNMHTCRGWRGAGTPPTLRPLTSTCCPRGRTSRPAPPGCACATGRAATSSCLRSGWWTGPSSSPPASRSRCSPFMLRLLWSAVVSAVWSRPLHSLTPAPGCCSLGSTGPCRQKLCSSAKCVKFSIQARLPANGADPICLLVQILSPISACLNIFRYCRPLALTCAQCVPGCDRSACAFWVASWLSATRSGPS